MVPSGRWRGSAQKAEMEITRDDFKERKTQVNISQTLRQRRAQYCKQILLFSPTSMEPRMAGSSGVQFLHKRKGKCPLLWDLRS